MKCLRKLIENLHDRYEYADSVEQLRQEQRQDRASRPLPMEYIEYEMQEGMLPENYEQIQPKPTGKHFNDYVWLKSKK